MTRALDLSKFIFCYRLWGICLRKIGILMVKNILRACRLLLCITLISGSIKLQASIIRFIAQTRSGTTLSTVCIEKLTGKTPCKYYFPKKWEDHLSNEYHFCKSNFFFGHSLNDAEFRYRSDRLIGQVRNYKERLLCSAYSQLPDKLDDLEVLRTFVLDPKKHTHYLSYLKVFDTWPTSQRFLLYYEDVVFESENTFTALSQFLHCPVRKLAKFLNHIDDYKQSCYRGYVAHHKRKCVARNDPRFYSKQVPNDLLVEMDNIMEKCAGHLYQKYLIRYKE